MRRRRGFFNVLFVLSVAATPSIVASCSCSSAEIDQPSASASSTGGGKSSSASAASGGNGGAPADATSTGSTISIGGGPSDGGCTNGEACGDGGVCAGNVCCVAQQACGDACCSVGAVCSFQKCEVPGADCHDDTDCAQGEYCEFSLGDNGDDGGTMEAGCQGGAVLLDGKCLPRPPQCAVDAGAPDGGAITCLEQCEFHPTGTFNPVLNYAWGGETTSPFSTDVMMAPIVVELDDDDCDGKVTANDIPEIVFSTFSGGSYGSAGVLHAISIVGGMVVEKWNVPGVVNATKQIAGGDIDGLPGNEIVACGEDGAVHAFNGVDGSPLWTSAPMTCFMPQIADVDGDGNVEVVVEGGILDGATGATKAAFTPPLNGTFVLSDIDGDGQLDVVTSARGYHADGSMFVDTGVAEAGMFDGTQDWKSPWPAIGDFDLDGVPEIVVADNLNHTLSVWHYDASQPQKFSELRAPVDINANFSMNPCGGSWGETHGGGPPTVADFDGDGIPDVGLAGGIGYVVFSGKDLLDPNVANPILWAQPTHDCSSASTGSTVFDFDGDGKAEVVYSDEYHLRIYDGTNGDVLFQTCNTTATLIEFPVVADVDNDGHADIVVVSNAYYDTCPDDGSKQAGVRIFGDANGTWVRTRRVWNEHPYHITNVNEDGTIPIPELPNWTQPGLNDFRQNKQPGSEFAAPDLVVSIQPVCPGPSALAATVRNIGEAAAPAGVVVGFYEGNPPSGTKLGQASTKTILYPAESEVVTLPLMNPDPALVNGTKPVYAVADDTTTPHPSWQECRTDNNVSTPESAACEIPK